ncbi:MAG TPA: hypothetical protein IAA06_04175 [Candidatus Blautia faecavium]|uniref:Collagen-like protein n=1 Tax=Candidatus Blautia faecavium TaxID=2838487 RepID=A0A9D2RV83_9FIRM|nr:hypothetical protein [Candidatus Blautia faecavium]
MKWFSRKKEEDNQQLQEQSMDFEEERDRGIFSNCRRPSSCRPGCNPCRPDPCCIKGPTGPTGPAGPTGPTGATGAVTDPLQDF